MSYRTGLPQLGGELFLTDGGLETTLIFHEGWTLPDFAAFHLLQDQVAKRRCTTISSPMPRLPAASEQV